MSSTGTRLEIIALPTAHRFQARDDLTGVLLEAATAAGTDLRDGDVICVASKAVSIVEGATAVLPDGDIQAGRRALAREKAVRVVAETAQVLITRTHHGFVCANGGIDASNVPSDPTTGGPRVLLLPADPDASARRIRSAIRARTRKKVGVIVTDTFGRPWRLGQTDVALGLAGVQAFRDERGSSDLDGVELSVSQAAVADEIAGAADLVRSKASGTPFVLVRGLASGQPGSGRDLVRTDELDVFRVGGPTAAEAAVRDRRTVRELRPDTPIPDHVLAAAVQAAVSAPAPHHTQPWRFIRLADRTRTALLDAMAGQWREDLATDGLSPAAIDRRIAHSDDLLRTAPELLVPFVVLDGAQHYRDARRTAAERDLFVLSAGAALQNLQIVLAAHGFGAAWVASTVFCADTVRTVLDLEATWTPVGMVAVGEPATAPSPRQPASVEHYLATR